MTRKHSGAVGAALVAAMDRHLAAARAGLAKLVEQIDAGRADGLDVSAWEQRMGALVAQVGRMAAERNALVAGRGRAHV